MKSEDAGVKNSIHIPGGERKKRIHRVGEIRKENSDNICEGKIMAILKGQSDLEVDNRNHNEHRSHITHKNTSGTGVVEGSRKDFENH
ncbi:hypothetical protein Tco_0808676 [Tanacetum coccineum]